MKAQKGRNGKKERDGRKKKIVLLPQRLLCNADNAWMRIIPSRMVGCAMVEWGIVRQGN